MKKLLPVLLFTIAAHLSFGQLPSLNMTLHSQWDPDTLPTASGREYNDIWGWVDCSGNEYAIIGSASMVHFFDINDPDNIVELAQFPGGQVTTWRDMKTFKDRAYAVSDNTNEGLMIFDLSNIQDTIIKTYHSTEFFGRAHNIYIDEDNGRLYVAGTNTQSSGLIVLDIATNPDNPQLLASVSLAGGGYVHDVYVKDNIAYCSHGYNGYYIWDFGIPAFPVQRASIVTGGYNHSSWLTADGNYAIYAEEVPLGQPLGVVDLSDVNNGNIEVVNTFKFPLLAPDHLNNVPHNPFIRGNYLFVSYYHDGVQIFDVSDPLNVSQVAYYDTHDNTSYSGYQGCWGVYPFLPSGVIIASDINEGLHILTADSLELAPVSPNLTPDATMVANIPSPMCEGETALLTVPSGEDTYQWYKDDQPVGLNQNFLFVDSSGTYHVEILDGQCSAVSEDIPIVVEPSPDLSSMPIGNFEVCANEGMTVEVPDNFDVYIWLKNGNIYQQGGNILQINEPGNYSLLAYLGNCSATSGILSVSILDVPDAVILNQEFGFCEGEQLALEANAGGDQYTWFFNNQEIAQTQSNIFVIGEGGSYQVQVTLDGCSEISDEVEVTEYEKPDLSLSFLGLSGSVDSNQVYLCYNESFILAVPADPNSQFQWYKNGVQTGDNSNTLLISEAGQYYVEATNINECYNQSSLIEVVISNPIAWIQLDGETLTNLSQWAAYQWYLNGNLIDGATNAEYTPTVSGEYHCEIIDEVGCGAVSNYIQVIVSGVEDIAGLVSVSIHPNPVSHMLNLTLNTAETQDFDIQIIHANGQIELFKSIEISGLQTFSFDLSGLSSGVYFVRIKNNEDQLIRRIVKI